MDYQNVILKKEKAPIMGLIFAVFSARYYFGYSYPANLASFVYIPW